MLCPCVVYLWDFCVVICVQKERKLLQVKRLDLDAAKTRLKKARMADARAAVRTHTRTHTLIEQFKWILLLVHSLANVFAGEENLSDVSHCHSVWSHTSTAWHTMLHNTRLTILFLVTCKESHEPPWEVLEFPFLNLISCFVFMFFRQTVVTLD